MIRVLVVEDSPTSRKLLIAILGGDPEIDVVGTAADGVDAVEQVAALRPDVITMDVGMPRMNGLEATKMIMNQQPTPIVLVSASFLAQDVAWSMTALAAGALTVVNKPSGPSAPDFEQVCRDLVETVKAMAQVKVVRRWPDRSAIQPPPAPSRHARCHVVAIAASTGGPGALHRILGELPANFPVPILLVQHIAIGFAPGFVSWLDSISPLAVKLAAPGELLRPGTVYVAPDDQHLGVADRRTIRIVKEPPIGGFRPSATYLYESLGRSFGDGVLGVILTGMGRDGVDGLRSLRAAGGPVIAQDEASSVVYGMSGAAVAEGLATAILSLDLIAKQIQLVVRGG